MIKVGDSLDRIFYTRLCQLFYVSLLRQSPFVLVQYLWYDFLGQFSHAGKIRVDRSVFLSSCGKHSSLLDRKKGFNTKMFYA
jgi:hypothetical protein